MGQKYVCFMPTSPQVMPEDDRIADTVRALIAAGIVQGDPAVIESLTNGPACQTLFRDTDPKKGPNGFAVDAGNMTFRIHKGEIAGFAGDNLEPVACTYCNSELPYDCAQDAFWGLRDGGLLTDPRMTMECLHCEKGNLALEADWGRSGGFARLAFIFEGETSNRVEPVAEGMELLTKSLGTPMRFVQVHSW